MFNFIRRYSESLNEDAWYLERVKENKNKPDYYGPFKDKVNAIKRRRQLLDLEYSC